MNEYDIKRLAAILAVQAEIEGMRADNQQRALNNESPAYSGDAFFRKSNGVRKSSSCT